MSLAARADDLDGDALTFRWSQLDGPGAPILADSTGPAEVTITPLELGTHVFRVVANDGYEDGPAREVTVVAKPSAGAIYVSSSGSERAGCGGFDEPCATLARGLEAAAASGISTVLLAAPSGAAPYQHCLALDGDTKLLGCYDPTTWRHDPELRPLCAIVCDAPRAMTEPGSEAMYLGHELSGAATVRDVRLDVSSKAVIAGNFGALITVGAHAGSTPTLDGVDIIAKCHAGCAAIGFVSDGASPTLDGVDVIGEAVGIEPVEIFVGMMLSNGEATITGTPAVRASGDGGRGGVDMQSPVDWLGFGLVLANGQYQVSSQSIRGGFGPSLMGVMIYGADVSLEGLSVDLVGYGARDMVGIAASPCTKADDGDFCTCADPDTCGTAGDSTLHSRLTLRDSHVLIVGGWQSAGLSPCFGAGVQLSTSLGGNVIEGNHIEVGAELSVAFGGFYAPMERTAGEAADRWTRNVIEMAGATSDPFCAGRDPTESSSGAAGLVLWGTQVDPAGPAGIRDGIDVIIEDNVLRVGVGSRITDVAPEHLGEAVTGIWHTKGVFGAEARIERNRIEMGGGAYASAGFTSDGSPAELRNNFIHGGMAPHSTGLMIDATASDAQAIRVEHNTIVGGGEGALTSTAVSLVAGAEGPTAGVFRNNLLDAGFGAGSRTVVAELNARVTSFDGDVWQLYDPARSGHPRPGLAASVRFGGSSSISDSGLDLWLVLLEGTGELAAVVSNTSPFKLQGGNALLKGGFAPEHVTRGTHLGSTWIGFVTTSGLEPSISILTSLGLLADMRSYSTKDNAGRSLVPHTAAYGQVVGSLTPDILFTVSAGGAGVPGLYVIEQDRGAVLPARKLGGVSLAQPTSIAAPHSDGRYLVLDGATQQIHVYDPSTGVIAQITNLNDASFTQVKQLHQLDADGAALDQAYDDLVVIDGDAVRLFLNLHDTSGTSFRELSAADPCVSATPTALALDRLPSANPQGLLVGCSDGALVLYEADGAWTQLSRVAGFDAAQLGLAPSSAISSIATRAKVGSTLALLTQADEDRIAFIEIAPDLALPNPPFFKVSAMDAGTLLGDVASAVLSSGLLDTSASPAAQHAASVVFRAAGDADACELTMHGDGGAPYDLHLANDDGNVCLGAVPAPGEHEGVNLDDIDAAGTRPANDARDKGADEYGAP